MSMRSCSGWFASQLSGNTMCAVVWMGCARGWKGNRFRSLICSGVIFASSSQLFTLLGRRLAGPAITALRPPLIMTPGMASPLKSKRPFM